MRTSIRCTGMGSFSCLSTVCKTDQVHTAFLISHFVTDTIGHVRYVSLRREGSGSNTPSRGRVVAGGTLVPASSRYREKMEKFFPLTFFQYFVSEMVLTCAVSICIICKYGNGEIFTQSKEENGSRHL